MFKKYRRTNIAEMRGVESNELSVMAMVDKDISVSQVDIDNGSPKLGDMIARNPSNHKDQWLVAEQYFIDNFEDA